MPQCLTASLRLARRIAEELRLEAECVEREMQIADERRLAEIQRKIREAKSKKAAMCTCSNCGLVQCYRHLVLCGRA